MWGMREEEEEEEEGLLACYCCVELPNLSLSKFGFERKRERGREGMRVFDDDDDADVVDGVDDGSLAGFLVF